MSENATLELALRKAPEAVMLTPPQIMVIAQTEFVPKSMRGNVPKVLACIARGRAMGIPDMVAVNGIDIIEGKASLSAELMVAIVREHGHSIEGDVTAERAVVRGKRRDNGDTMTAEFNREMAETAGLLGKANWKRHPDDMMWARAVSKLCRRLFADCFAGATYAPDDLLPTADETHDDPDVAGWVSGGVAEAGLGQAGEATQGSADGAASGASAEPSGPPASVTPWATLCKTLEADPGDLTLDDVKAKGREMFPGRSPQSLTDDECVALWNALKDRVAV